MFDDCNSVVANLFHASTEASKCAIIHPHNAIRIVIFENV